VATAAGLAEVAGSRFTRAACATGDPAAATHSGARWVRPGGSVPISGVVETARESLVIGTL